MFLSHQCTLYMTMAILHTSCSRSEQTALRDRHPKLYDLDLNEMGLWQPTL